MYHILACCELKACTIEIQLQSINSSGNPSRIKSHRFLLVFHLVFDLLGISTTIPFYRF